MKPTQKILGCSGKVPRGATAQKWLLCYKVVGCVFFLIGLLWGGGGRVGEGAFSNRLTTLSILFTSLHNLNMLDNFEICCNLCILVILVIFPICVFLCAELYRRAQSPFGVA